MGLIDYLAGFILVLFRTHNHNSPRNTIFYNVFIGLKGLRIAKIKKKYLCAKNKGTGDAKLMCDRS